MSKYDTLEDIWEEPRNTKRAGNNAPQHSSRGSKKKSKKKHNTARIVTNIVLSIILVLSLTIGAAGYVIGYLELNNEANDPNAEQVDFEVIEKLEGSTNPDVTYFLVVGTDEEECLTDIILVVCFDHGKGTASVLQIPRDTFISANIPTGKINAVAYYGADKGVKTNIYSLMQVINEYFGLPVDHYLNVSIDCFREIVDAIGGIDVQVEVSMRAWDKYKQFYNFEPGLNHFNGSQAEAYVRHRNSYYQGDIGRVEAQRNFYAAFAKKIINMNYAEMAAIVKNCYNDIKTDLSVGLLLGYAKAAQKLSLDNIVIETVPGTSGYAKPYGMSQQLSYFSLFKADYVNVVNAYFMPYEQKITVDDVKATELFGSTGVKVTAEGTSFGDLLKEDDEETESDSSKAS